MPLYNKNEAVKYNPTDLSEEKERAKESRFIKNDLSMERSGFSIDPQVATHIGLTEAKNKEERRQFDAEVLKYVQKIKDDAYEEAFKIGKEEGIKVAKEEALAAAKHEISESLESLLHLVESLNNQRQKMYEANEAEIVRFCYYVAKKILLHEVSQNKEYVVQFIKKVIPEDEPCLIRVSPKDHAFIKNHLNLLEKDIDMSNIRFEPDTSFQDGDVVVETENGILDGSISTRFEKLKNALEQTES